MSVEWSGEGGSPLHSHGAGTFVSPYIKTGRGIGTETCGVNCVFPPDDLKSLLLFQYSSILYIIYLWIAVFIDDTTPWDVFCPWICIFEKWTLYLDD